MTFAALRRLARTPTCVRAWTATMLGVALSAPALAAPIVQLTAMPVLFDMAIGLDEYEPTGRLVETRNFPNGTGGNLALMSLPQLGPAPFFRISSPPSTPFSSLAGVPGEINLLTVKSGHSFAAPVGTVFAVDLTGLIRKISADGSSVTDFVQLPNSSGPGVPGDNINLAMDTTGQWGGRIVASSGGGKLFLIDANGQFETLATGMGRLQGVNFIPNDPARWGRYAGCILAGTEGNETQAQSPTHLWCRAPDGSITHETRNLGVKAEDVDVIGGGNFYALDWGQGRLWGAQEGAFASLLGDMLLTQEGSRPGSSNLFHVGYDIGNDEFTVQELDLQFSIGNSSSHSWEQVIFTNVDMFNPPEVNGVPEPAGLALALSALGLAAGFSRRR